MATYRAFVKYIIADFTVLGSKAIFVGSGARPGSDLWVTDGTSAGTTELSASYFPAQKSRM